MKLTELFNKRISVLAQNTKIGEIELFRALIDSLTSNSYSFEIHGRKGLVSFKNPAQCSSSLSNIKCELCDVVIVSFNSSEIRTTFLQAKYFRKYNFSATLGNLSFPVRQHYLLSSFPLFEPKGKATFYFPKDCLEKRTLDSIGSFGIFYKKNKNIFDMSYQIASLWKSVGKIPNHKFCDNTNFKYRFSGTIDKVNCYKNFSELEACSGLDSFEAALLNMQIGDPILSNNVQMVRNLRSIAKEHLSLDKENETLFKFINQFKDNTIYNSDNEETAFLRKPNIVFIDVEKAYEFI